MIFVRVIIAILIACTAQVAGGPPDDDYDGVDDIIENQNQTTTTPRNDLENLINEEIVFTYGDDDLFGPLHWRSKKTMKNALASSTNLNEKMKSTITSKAEKLYAGSHCQTNWISPINIETHRVHPTPEKIDFDNEDENEDDQGRDLDQGIPASPEALTISVLIPDVQLTTWAFGHPTRYHGIQIYPDKLSIIQLKDTFLDPFQATSETESDIGTLVTYDFNFLTLFYCDIRKSLPYRTMHQIDGKRFPLELAFVFLRKIEDKEPVASNKLEVDYSADDGDDESQVKDAEFRAALYDGEYETVIVSVLGEIGETDNEHFTPVVEAAKKFTGEDFDINHTSINTVKTPWSPTWLLPPSSKYYYYDGGSFPVPPCWSVARYYIMSDRITISQAQIDALSHIRSNRERNPKKRLACTYSTSSVDNSPNETKLMSTKQVNYNLIEYKRIGEDDGRPITLEELNTQMNRQRKEGNFQERLVADVLGGNFAAGVNYSCLKLLLFSFALTQFYCHK